MSASLSSRVTIASRPWRLPFGHRPGEPPSKGHADSREKASLLHRSTVNSRRSRFRDDANGTTLRRFRHRPGPFMRWSFSLSSFNSAILLHTRPRNFAQRSFALLERGFAPTSASLVATGCPAGTSNSPAASSVANARFT